MNILDLMMNNDILKKINKYTTEIKRNKNNFNDVLWDIKMLNYSNSYSVRSWSPRDYFDWCYENEQTDEWYNHIKDCCECLNHFRYYTSNYPYFVKEDIDSQDWSNLHKELLWTTKL